MFAVCSPEELTGKELVYVIKCNLAAVFIVLQHRIFADSQPGFDFSNFKTSSLDIIHFLILLLGIVF